MSLYHTVSSEVNAIDTNTFGMKYQIIMKETKEESRTSASTTLLSYPMFLNDLYFLSTSDYGLEGKSLIRSSDDYAYQNYSFDELILYDFGYGEYVPLPVALYRKYIGPMGSIDLWSINLPNYLNLFTTSILQILQYELRNNLET